ncbi:MAG TPA: PspC domain-containing protein [Solimonas sp.]|nr:PspC domain-containing protein [Solimonas sp.]
MNNAERTNPWDGILTRMRRYPDRGWVAGVCAGVADYFNWNLKLVRLLVILALIFSWAFPVIVIYIALWYMLDVGTDGEPRHHHRSGSTPPSTPPSGRRGPMTASGAKAHFDRLEKRLQQMEACVSQEDLELRRQFKQLER